ncbi:zinc finger domain-containing protein [Streptomyces oceani]|uniref:zinc finger domain-containing protein n=1 Tax=Streptomyces oceani TaxID=1075402 RepID=UPI003B847B5B
MDHLPDLATAVEQLDCPTCAVAAGSACRTRGGGPGQLTQRRASPGASRLVSSEITSGEGLK